MPWGDPDVSGTWSTDDLRGVPTQRPDQFAGRSELSDAEFAERVAANNQTRTRELNRVGAFRNDVGTRTFRQTSLVVEPADGRIPPMTPVAQARGAAVAAVRRSAPGSWLDRSTAADLAPAPALSAAATHSCLGGGSGLPPRAYPLTRGGPPLTSTWRAVEHDHCRHVILRDVESPNGHHHSRHARACP